MRDSGTHEAQARRAALVNGHADPTLFSIPVDIMFARCLIDRDQHSAGQRFRSARAAVHPLPLKGYSPIAQLVEPVIGGRAISEAEEKRRERHYNGMLRRLSVEQQLALVDLALDVWPAWLKRHVAGVPFTAEDEAERGDLLAGLDRLR